MHDIHNIEEVLPVHILSIVGVAEVHFGDLRVASKIKDKFDLRPTFPRPKIMWWPIPAILDVVYKSYSSIKYVRPSIRIINNCGVHLTVLSCDEGNESDLSWQCHFETSTTSPPFSTHE